MSTWTERARANPVHQTIRDFESILEGTDAKLLTTESALGDHDRLRQVVAFVRRAVDGTDPNLCPPPLLDGINNALAQAQTNYQNFLSNPSVPTYLQQANTNADSALQQAMVLPAIRDDGDARGVREAITNLRQSVAQHLRNVADDVGRLRATTDEAGTRAQALAADIDAQKGRLDTAITTFQQQFSTAQETRSAEFAKAQSTQASAAVDAERARAAEHADAEQARQTAAEEALAARQAAAEAAFAAEREQFGRLVSDLRAEREEAERRLAEQSRTHLQELEEHRARAAALVGIIAETGMVGGFQRVANEERRAARFWLGIATGALVGLVVSAGWIAHLSLAGGAGFHWEAAATRAFLSLAFVALAGFAARQAADHQGVERRNRRMELELASVGPFLQQLPEDDRNTMLKQLADRMFAQAPSPPQSGEAPVKLPAAELLSVAKSAIDLAAKK